ncbi:MAG TPA: alpha/beta hydrolase-fold protein [Mycobacteriales bacterium]|jgi:S-formylglutathione hydrolase FrmB|nr:alpha/beta hydrolase-fold protein [Mycobacteriales bacterium]
MTDAGLTRRTLLTGAAGAAVVLGGGAVLGKHELNVHPSLRERLFGCGSTPPVPHDTQHQILTHTIQSKAMGRSMPFTVALPDAVAFGPDLGSRTSLILALPGEGGSATSITQHLGLQAFATAGGLPACVVSPGDVRSSYYHPRTDGTDVLAFLVDELVPHVEQSFPVGGSRDRRGLYGYSMGGFGALLIAQRRPEMFCAAAAASPAVFPSYSAAITGHSGTFDSQTDWDVNGVWQHLSSMGAVPIRIDCGNEDPFVATARQLISKIPGAVGQIGSGCHDVGFWRRAAPADIVFLKNQLSS